jgi:hypothetical protein
MSALRRSVACAAWWRSRLTKRPSSAARTLSSLSLAQASNCVQSLHETKRHTTSNGIALSAALAATRTAASLSLTRETTRPTMLRLASNDSPSTRTAPARSFDDESLAATSQSFLPIGPVSSARCGRSTMLGMTLAIRSKANWRTLSTGSLSMRSSASAMKRGVATP